MGLGGEMFHYDWVAKAKSGPPPDDFGLIVAWRSPFTAQRRRAFLCAGFTSYGTAAAAEYLIRDLCHSKCRGHRPTFPTRWHPHRQTKRYTGHDVLPPAVYFRRWPLFATIVAFKMVDGSVVSRPKELVFVALEDSIAI